YQLVNFPALDPEAEASESGYLPPLKDLLALYQERRNDVLGEIANLKTSDVRSEEELMHLQQELADLDDRVLWASQAVSNAQSPSNETQGVPTRSSIEVSQKQNTSNVDVSTEFPTPS